MALSAAAATVSERGTASGEKLYDSVLTLSYEIGGRPYLREVGSIHLSTNYERKRKQAQRFAAGELGVQLGILPWEQSGSAVVPIP